MNRSLNALLTLAQAVLFLSGVCHGGYVVQDGNFESSGDVTSTSIANAGWFEQNNIGDSNAEFILAESASNVPAGGDGDATTSGDVYAVFGTVVNTAGKTGRIYQNIGTYAGETGLQIQFTVIDLTNRDFADLTVELWHGGTPGSASDGVTLASLGATLASATTITASEVTTSGAKVITVNLNFTGAVAGEAIWLAFAKLTPGSNSVAAFDDVSVAPLTPPATGTAIFLLFD